MFYLGPTQRECTIELLNVTQGNLVPAMDKFLEPGKVLAGALPVPPSPWYGHTQSHMELVQIYNWVC